MRIGWVCWQWSTLEHLLLRSMRKMIGSTDDELGKILFGGLDIRPRLAMASELAKYYKTPLPFRKALAKVSAAMDAGLLKKRNRAIHGTQFLYEDGELHVEVHRGRDKSRSPLSSRDLYDLSAEIREVSEALNVAACRYLWKMEPRPFALLEKPAPQSRKKKAPKQDQKPKPRAPRQKASPEKSQPQ